MKPAVKSPDLINGYDDIRLKLKWKANVKSRAALKRQTKMAGCNPTVRQLGEGWLGVGANEKVRWAYEVGQEAPRLFLW
jgi:hypothetical protein